MITVVSLSVLQIIRILFRKIVLDMQTTHNLSVPFEIFSLSDNWKYILGRTHTAIPKTMCYILHLIALTNLEANLENQHKKSFKTQRKPKERNSTMHNFDFRVWIGAKPIASIYSRLQNKAAFVVSRRSIGLFEIHIVFEMSLDSATARFASMETQPYNSRSSVPFGSTKVLRRKYLDHQLKEPGSRTVTSSR